MVGRWERGEVILKTGYYPKRKGLVVKKTEKNKTGVTGKKQQRGRKRRKKERILSGKLNRN